MTALISPSPKTGLSMLLLYTGWYFSSALEWMHQHVIGHHIYTNVPRKDPDLYHNASMERHTNTLKWRPLHRHQALTWIPIWAIGTFAMSYLKPLQLFLTGKYNRSVAIMELDTTRIVLHFTGRVFVFFMCHVWPFLFFSFGKAVLFATIPVAVVSISFMLASQVNHLSHENVDRYSPDFYKHQVITAHSFAHNNYLTFLFTGGLNYQAEHHLFPCVNHCHHKNIHDIVVSVCKKHNVDYHYSPSLWAAFKKYVSHMAELAVKPKEQ
eukprot:m.187234 g.187234  ORF g.187234 m.187234 type:complete len:267 (+) comp13623_c1_seq17:600-1400(+)